MKRNLLLALVLAGSVTSLAGQDRIVTSGFDTIDCRITRITLNTVFFDVMTHGVKASGRLNLKDVYSYSVMPSSIPDRKQEKSLTEGQKQDYVKMQEDDRNRELNHAPTVVPDARTGNLRISLNGGLGYITASSDKAEESLTAIGVSSADATDYYSDLKSGFYGSADAIWLFNPRVGAGLRYKFFNTRALTEGYFNPGDNYNLYYTTYSENIYVSYSGVSLFYSDPAGRKGLFSLTSSVSAGIALYRDETDLLSEALLITGKAPGMDMSVGFEYWITPFMSAGAEVSVFASSLRKINITNGVEEQTHELGKDEYENLTRLEVAFGIRFYLWEK